MVDFADSKKVVEIIVEILNPVVGYQHALERANNITTGIIYLDSSDYGELIFEGIDVLRHSFCDCEGFKISDQEVKELVDVILDKIGN